MPVTTIDGANVNWGVMSFTGGTVTFTSGLNPNLQAARGSALATWMNFKGITIPQGSTINSATLGTHLCTNNSGGEFMLVNFENNGTPASPPPSISAILFGAGVTSFTVTDYTSQSLGFPPTPWSTQVAPTNNPYAPYPVDVTSTVQSLVDSYDYSNGDMMFYIAAGGSTFAVFVYPSGRGTVKDPELVIDFTVASSLEPDKTTYHFG